MAFSLQWTAEARDAYKSLEEAGEAAHATRLKSNKVKESKQEGLFKQVHKTLALLANDPKHPSLQTHKYDGIANPLNAKNLSLRRMHETARRARIESFGAMARGKAS